MKITRCDARTITDSRGMPTVEVELSSENYTATAAVPSGKSTGSREALELRDSDGRGVESAVANIKERIAPEIIGKTFSLREIDTLMREIDGTENKRMLGANAILGVSMAFARLSAKESGVPLWKWLGGEAECDPAPPHLFMNVLNGGAHSDFRLPFQEYIIVPETTSLSRAYQAAREVLEMLGKRLEGAPLGDEGGYSPSFSDINAPFELLSEVTTESSEDFTLAIDAAASEFCKDGEYHLLDKTYAPEELLNLYKELVRDFPLRSIEDPFEESDVEHFAKAVAVLGDRALVVGDDLTVTNPDRIAQVGAAGAATAVIIKPNQIGTLSEVFESARRAREMGWKLISSHRSGETLDTFIADLAVGIGAYGIKAGSPLQREREVKYARLLEIERELEDYRSM